MHIPSGHVQRGVATCEPSVRGKFCTKHPDGARRRHPRRLVRRWRGLVAQGHTAGRRLLPRCTVRFDPWTASPDLVWTGDFFGAHTSARRPSPEAQASPTHKPPAHAEPGAALGCRRPKLAATAPPAVDAAVLVQLQCVGPSLAWQPAGRHRALPAGDCPLSFATSAG